jgi:UDP-2-acetamido-2-deoxy-ribo-hexuluronate aminotransferase
LTRNRDEVAAALKEIGIPTAVHYPIPLNKQPAVQDTDVRLRIGDEIAELVISLPMHPYLSVSDQELIVKSLALHLK